MSLLRAEPIARSEEVTTFVYFPLVIVLFRVGELSGIIATVILALTVAAVAKCLLGRANDVNSFVAVFHEPLTAGETRQTRIVYSVDGHEDEDLRKFNELFDVFQEDVAVVESVQLGLASPGYRGGRLIEDCRARAGWSEHAVGYFQDLVRSPIAN